ncbi:MAG: Ig-like domain-containing protein [Lachnospiraceae bacterium]|nr:Ig-like domain-containing protein [Lachnospiraceae bacterium]
MGDKKVKKQLGNKFFSSILAMMVVITTIFSNDLTGIAATKSKITLSSKQETIAVGKSVQLKVKAIKGLKGKSVTWKSSNVKVAKVSSKGKVTGLKAGNVKITATSKVNKKVIATCKITVKKDAVESIRLDKTACVVIKGKTEKIKIKDVVPTTASSNITWKVKKSAIAKVSVKGKTAIVTGKKAGKTTLIATATDGSKKTAEVEILVVNKKSNVKKVAEVQVSLGEKEILVGSTTKAKAVMKPSNATLKTVYWSTSNEKIAKIDASGKITAIKAGQVKITATAQDGSGKKGTVTLVVKDNVEPTEEPKITVEPTVVPTVEPVVTDMPTKTPTRKPEVTEIPTHVPTEKLEITNVPTQEPKATGKPIATPTTEPMATEIPTRVPTEIPIKIPTVAPTNEPTAVPTNEPTAAPTNVPTATPTKAPTNTPTVVPTNVSTVTPTKAPTNAPMVTPTKTPTNAPMVTPTKAPTVVPTNTPTITSTITPTKVPTVIPTNTPTTEPQVTEPPAEIWYEGVEEAGKALREKLKKRNSTIELKYKISGDVDGTFIKTLMGNIVTEALKHTGVPTEGDYIEKQMGSYQKVANYYSDGSAYYLTITYNVTYYTTAEQEAEVDSKIAEVIHGLNLDGKSDYEKVKEIYDYICKNVTYDYTNLENESYELKYTAYAALVNKTSVCQGYANLLYRMLLEAGVDSRIITGTSKNEGHAWNVVKLDDKYYYLDSTWDASYFTTFSSYGYFLKGTSDFADHTLDSKFEAVEFKEKYSIPDSNYQS